MSENLGKRGIDAATKMADSKLDKRFAIPNKFFFASLSLIVFR